MSEDNIRKGRLHLINKEDQEELAVILLRNGYRVSYLQSDVGIYIEKSAYYWKGDQKEETQYMDVLPDIKCKSKYDPCGLCKSMNYNVCWYDPCPLCGEIRIEHRYGMMGCGRKLDKEGNFK